MAETKPKLEEMKFRAPYRAQEKVAYTKRPDTKSMQLQLDQAGKVEDPAPMIYCYCWAYTEAWYCWEEGLLLIRASVDTHGDYADRRFLEAVPPEASIFQTSWNVAVEDMPVKAHEWAAKVRAILTDKMADAFVVDPFPAEVTMAVVADRAQTIMDADSAKDEPIPNEDNDSASGFGDDMPDAVTPLSDLNATTIRGPRKSKADADAEQMATIKEGIRTGKYRGGKGKVK